MLLIALQRLDEKIHVDEKYDEENYKKELADLKQEQEVNQKRIAFLEAYVNPEHNVSVEFFKCVLATRVVWACMLGRNLFDGIPVIAAVERSMMNRLMEPKFHFHNCCPLRRCTSSTQLSTPIGTRSGARWRTLPMKSRFSNPRTRTRSTPSL